MPEFDDSDMDAHYDRVLDDEGSNQSDIVLVRGVPTVSGPAFMDVWPRWQLPADQVQHVTVEPRVASDGGLAFYRRFENGRLEYLFGVGPEATIPWTAMVHATAVQSQLEQGQEVESVQVINSGPKPRFSLRERPWVCFDCFRHGVVTIVVQCWRTLKIALTGTW
jgi:hypothetical protein